MDNSKNKPKDWSENLKNKMRADFMQTSEFWALIFYKICKMALTPITHSTMAV